MSILTKLREAFTGKPKLRNQPGGMAWINSGIDEGDGAAALVGRVVRTVRVKTGDMWAIDPPQIYTITHQSYNRPSGIEARPGSRVLSIAIRDNCLTPIEGDVDAEEVRELYAPKVRETA